MKLRKGTTLAVFLALVGFLGSGAITAHADGEVYSTYLPQVAQGCEKGAAVTDPYYVDQYSMAMIHADDAWSECILGEGVVVAVLGSGFDLNHPDLSFVPGYDFIDDDTDTQEDFSGNTTGSAGIISAKLNNGVGVVGVAPGARIMPIRTLDYGKWTPDGVAEGINFAVANGARVVHIGDVGEETSAALEQAVKDAFAAGVVLVAADGEDGWMDNPPITYPTAYPEVISVSKVNMYGEYVSYSTPADYMDFAAPGHNVLSTHYDDIYANSQGPMASSAHVAGAAALILSVHPEYSPVEVYAALVHLAVDMEEEGWDEKTGYGLLNVDPSEGYIYTSDDLAAAKTAMGQ